MLSSFFKVGIHEKAKTLECQSTVIEMARMVLDDICQCNCFSDGDLTTEQAFESQCTCNKQAGLNAIFFDTKDKKMIRKSIPDAVLINGNIYTLFAIIERLKFPEKSHFTAAVRRANRQWQLLDQNSTKITKPNWRKNIIVHMVGYKLEQSKHIEKFESTWDRMESDLWPIIRNFHTFIFNGLIVKVYNSCGPDAVLHSLCCINHVTPAVFEAESFQQTEMVALLNAYEERNEGKVYEHRIKLFIKSGFKISFNGEAVIDMNSNIDSALRMLCLPHLASGTIQRTCKCGTRRHDLSTIEVDMEKLVDEGIQKLDTCFVNNIQKIRDLCITCQIEVESILTYSPLIFIGTEPFAYNEREIKLPKLKLSELPKQIEFDSKTYHLKAAIEYHHNVKHYSSHCLMEENFFEFDDLNVKAKQSKTDEIDIHLLIFTSL